MKGNVFVPVQALNAMRRDALEALEKEILNRYKRVMPEISDVGDGETEEMCDQQECSQQEFTALVSSKEQLEAVLGCMSAWKEEDAEREFGIYLASEEFLFR